MCPIDSSASFFFSTATVLPPFYPIHFLSIFPYLHRFLSLSLFSHPNSFYLFCYNIYSLVYLVIHLFFCRQVQGARKSAMSAAYRGFHGSAVKLHSRLLFPARSWRAAWQAASRFVLPNCRELSPGPSRVLTTAARPMHEWAKRAAERSGSLGYPAVPFSSPLPSLRIYSARPCRM